MLTRHVCVFVVFAGDSVSTRGFIYFHGAAKEYEADVDKPQVGKGAWGFKDLCWQRRMPPYAMQRSMGYSMLPDEVTEVASPK